MGTRGWIASTGWRTRNGADPSRPGRLNFALDQHGHPVGSLNRHRLVATDEVRRDCMPDM